MSHESEASPDQPTEQHSEKYELPDDGLTGHSYDGIQEYDNPLPGWWKAIFVLSILYAIPYLMYYHNGVEERSIHGAYDQAVAANLRLQFAEIGELEPDRKTILKYMDDDEWKLVGQTVFKTHCVSCHGDKGQGKVGPNLTDDLWKNVKKVEDIATVVIRGAGGKAMPAWNNRLHPNEIVLVSSYVASLRGSLPPGTSGKAPIKGEKEIPPWGNATSDEADTKVDGGDETDESEGTGKESASS